MSESEIEAIRESKVEMVKKLRKDLSVFLEYQANRHRSYQQQSDQVKAKYNPQLEIQ